MRTYTLTDRDFQEFFAIMEKIELENRMKHGHSCPTSPCKECDLLATYRLNFIRWRNSVMGGDSYAERFHHIPEEGLTLIKREIERLQQLLPEEVAR